MTAADLAEWAFPNRATPPGSSAYYSVRLSPAGSRDALAALFGWRQQVRAVAERVSDPGVARLKLDWWRQEAQRLGAGTPQHPVSRLLCARLPSRALPGGPLCSIIEQTEAELRGRWPTDDASWAAAAVADLGALFELLCRAEGHGEPDLLALARHWGGWCGRIRWLRDAGLLLRHGRTLLPAQRLTADGLAAGLPATADGRARLPVLLSPLAAELANSAPGRGDLAPLPVVVRAQVRIHAVLLRELRAAGLAVAEQRIGLTPLRKLWLAWRAC